MLSAEKEQTKCYKCQKDIEAFVGQVHPLCDFCQDDFDDWFLNQLSRF